MKVFNLRNIEHKQLSSKSEEFSLSAILSDIVEFNKIFVHHEILSPGKRSSSLHSHSKREEMVVVLEGNPTIQLGSIKRQLQPGDFVGFQPNEEHCVWNMSSEDAYLLVICSGDADDKVAY